jgi:hypothetical protein
MTRPLIGTIFRDDQFYPQEGQKAKHTGYDPSRHYKFWIERIQALETKEFTEAELAKIRYVIDRDQIRPQELNCETIRRVLKDPHVRGTRLNDHASLLVARFGGPTPPRLIYSERQTAATRFNTCMKIYDRLYPDGGNKPYYPYFIYKILENMFIGQPDKLRILGYIHLQSRETVIKNDRTWAEICKEMGGTDGFVYRPTDPGAKPRCG